MGVKYDTEAGILEVALQIAGTVIPPVLDGKEFWILLVTNILVRTLRDRGIIHPSRYDLDLPFSLTGVTGSLMTFFVCFYNGHQFGRYNHLYDVTQALCENVLELCVKLRVELKPRQLQRKVAKLVTASVIMFYLERTGGGEDGKVSKREFKQLWHLGLLDEDEIRSLRRHCRNLRQDSVAAFLVLQWAMEILLKNTKNPANHEDMLHGFIGHMYKLREHQAIVIQTMELPMPFQYFHIMNFMLMLNLVLWAYALACQDSMFAPMIFMFVQLMFQGIRQLSTSLADPFGQEEVDFAINDWLVTLYQRVHSIIEDEFDVCEGCTISGQMLPPAEAAPKINPHEDLQISRDLR